MAKQDADAAQKFISDLQEDQISRLNYARRLVEGRSRAAFLPDGLFHCHFAGNVLVTVINRSDEVAVYVQDADDWGMELVVGTVAKAEKVFDDLFHDCPTYDARLEEKLRQYGFVHI